MRVKRISVFFFLLTFSIVAVLAGRWCRSRRQVPLDGRELHAEPSPVAVAKADATVAAAPQAERLPSSAGDTPYKQQEPVAKDQAAAESMRALLASGNVDGTLKLARQLLKSENVSVRSEVVQVLGRIGFKALPELSDMLYDTDPGLNRDVFRHWKEIVSKIPEEGKKNRILVASMSVMGEKEKINELATVLSELPKPLAVRSLVSLIQSANPCASEVAAAHYQRMTGAPYTTPQATEEWLKGLNHTEETPAK